MALVLSFRILGFYGTVKLPDKLYYDSSDAFSVEDKDITLVPYASWNNRSEGEMLVWMAED